MSTPTDQLNRSAEYHDGTETAKLLRWATLHIKSQDEALAELSEEHQTEDAERIKLENALHSSKQHVEQALQTLQSAWWCHPVYFSRDMVPHINLMAGHGDPDYLKYSSNRIRHLTRALPSRVHNARQSHEKNHRPRLRWPARSPDG